MDFGRHSSLRVSEYALRSTARGYGSGPKEARRVFDRYAERGGNFLDTTHFYQFGDSERLLADFVASNRNDFILATNSVSAAPFKPLNDNRQQPRRHDSFCVEESLKRLKTDRVDLLWVHMPDGVTPIEEIVRGLDNLAHAGKIIYAGLSGFPAWRVERAATICELRRYGL